MRKPNPGPPPGPPPAMPVLIVDDHQLFTDGLARLLADHPGVMLVGKCRDLASAWAMIAEKRPALVLMDVDLPDGSGIGLTRRIRDAYPATKVLVLTSFQRDDFAREAIAAGARGYLVKTHAAGELFDAIRTVLAGGIHLSASTAPAGPAPRANAAFTADQPPRRNLPARERQVLERLVRGERNKEIAAALGLSVKTVETYRSRLMKRFDCGNVPELVRCAIREGFAPL